MPSYRVTNLSEVGPGELIRVECQGVPLCIARTADGEVFAVRDECSHEASELSDGAVVGTEVECPIHLGRFDLRTGAACGAPAVDPIRTFPTTVDGNAVLVELE